MKNGHLDNRLCGWAVSLYSIKIYFKNNQTHYQKQNTSETMIRHL